jgi:succinate dehydrogenase/fumarate reductase flavoprotein subunit
MSREGMGLKNTTLQYNYGWVDAIDIGNMLDVCELTILSALNRTESRGPFYRPEYPYTDNVHWHAKNILFRGVDGCAAFRKEAYPTPYLKPEFERMDYFSVNW